MCINVCVCVCVCVFRPATVVCHRVPALHPSGCPAAVLHPLIIIIIITITITRLSRFLSQETSRDQGPHSQKHLNIVPNNSKCENLRQTVILKLRIKSRRNIRS